MADTKVDEHLVGYAQGLLQDGVRVWISRQGTAERLPIVSIHIADDTKAVFIELKGEDRMILAPGQLGCVFAEAAGR